MATFLVTNTLDGGAGSLRAALAAAEADSVPSAIRFAASLKGATITLNAPLKMSAGTATISGDLDGDGDPDVTIDAGGFDASAGYGHLADRRHFEIEAGASLSLVSLVLSHGDDIAGPGDTEPVVASIINAGRLTIRDSVFVQLSARSTDARSGEPAPPGVAFIHNLASAEMLVFNTSFTDSVALAGSPASIGPGETNNDAGFAVGGILNDGSISVGRIGFLRSRAEGADASAFGNKGGDGVFGVLNRGVLVGIGDYPSERPLVAGIAGVGGRGLGESVDGRGLVGFIDMHGGVGGAAANARIVSAGEFEPGRDAFSSRVIGFAGDDNIGGGAGDDTITGGAGDDRLNGGERNDLIFGEAGRDTLIGGTGRDTLHGGDGDDELIFDQSLGSDDLATFSGEAFGGLGDDLFRVTSPGFLLIEGGVGDDLLHIQSNRLGNIVVDLALSGVQTAGGGLNLRLSSLEHVATFRFDDRISGNGVANWIDGGNGDDTMNGRGGEDTLVGDFGADVLRGAAGDDLLNGGFGGDRLFGGVGDDLIQGRQEADFLKGGAGRDTLQGGEDTDTLLGGGGADVLDGGLDGGLDESGDLLFGGGGRDTLQGFGGSDTLAGGRGADHLSGNRGGDVFVFSRGDGRDTIGDFLLGPDVIAFLSGPAEFDDLTIRQRGDDAVIRYAGGQVIVLDFKASDFEDFHFLF